MSAIITVMPVSGCLRMKSVIGPTIRNTESGPWVNSRIRSWRPLRNFARKNTSANFTSSEGSAITGPSLSHRRAPPFISPSPGTYSSASITSEMTNSGMAIRRRPASENCDSSMRKMKPTAICARCSLKKWNASPRFSMPRKYVVFSTISRPSNSSTAAGSHSHGSGRRYVTASKRPNQLFIYVPTFRIVLELVEARARRRQQYSVSGPRRAGRVLNGFLKSRHRFDLRRTAECGRHLVPRCTVQNRKLDLLAERPSERRIVAAFVETAGDQNYRRRERIDRLDHRADVGALRIVDVSHAAALVHYFNPMGQSAK